jgi:hypothetical protein
MATEVMKVECNRKMANIHKETLVVIGIYNFTNLTIFPSSIGLLSNVLERHFITKMVIVPA